MRLASKLFRDVNPSLVDVICLNGPLSQDASRRFIGTKVGDNPDGTIRIQVSGQVDDLKQAVFWRA